MLRRLVACFGHAPGLWLLYGEPLPRRLRWPNVIAVVATVLGVIVFGWPAWPVGHLAWGLYLAWQLPPR